MELKNRIESGDFGKFIILKGAMIMAALGNSLMDGEEDSNYSVTHGGGIHLIDLVVWLFKKVATVRAGNKSIKGPFSRVHLSLRLSFSLRTAQPLRLRSIMQALLPTITR